MDFKSEQLAYCGIYCVKRTLMDVLILAPFNTTMPKKERPHVSSLHRKSKNNGINWL